MEPPPLRDLTPYSGTYEQDYLSRSLNLSFLSANSTFHPSR